VYELVVVGAGLIGAAAARHAAQRVLSRGRVALVGPAEDPREGWAERRAFGAHHDEGRITRCTDPEPTWALLAQRSIDRYGTIANESGVEFFDEVGHLAVGPPDSLSLSARASNAAAAGVPFEWLDESALRLRFPYLHFPPNAKAVWEPQRSGYISARRLVKAQTCSATSSGCDRVEAEAERIVDEDGRGFCTVHLRGGGVVRARKVLLACGAFTNGPAALIPEGKSLELNNTTTQTVHFSLSEADAARLQKMPSLIAKFDHWWAYVLPPIRYPDGRIVLKLGGARTAAATPVTGASNASLAGTRPLASPADLIEWYRTAGEPAATAEMAEMLRSLIPEVEPLEVRSDACANCRTPTGLPYIGELLGDDGRPILRGGDGGHMYVATGGNGLAAKSSDEIGRLAACAVLSVGGWDPEEKHPLLAAERFTPRLRPSVNVQASPLPQQKAKWYD